MKNYNEIAESVLKRKNEYKRNKRKKLTNISILASSCILITILGISVFLDRFPKENPLPISITSSHTEQYSETTTHNERKNNSDIQNESTTNHKQKPDDEGFSSGGDFISSWFIPALPFDTDVTLTGQEITDSEAHEYFEKNKDNIIGSLSASGVPTESIKLSDKGYCHISYDGVEGKSFEIRQNYRDYLLYIDDELIAIITLWKENGEISATPSFGAAWFDDYNTYLNEHKGEELVFVYAGWMEIIIAPDNTYSNPMGYDVSNYLEGVTEPYNLFYHKEAVFVP